ncbi:Non-canonical purine NTP pyrophosphatase [compost metagenome]
MKVLIATKNKAKISKYSAMLEKIGIGYTTLEELEISNNIEETGNTVEENSEIKAKEYYRLSNMPVIADDSGLIIDKLPIDKQPGIFVRRYMGKELSDEEIINIYSKEIEEVGGESEGTFNIAITAINEFGQVFTKLTKHNRLFVSKPSKSRVEGYPMNSLIFNKNKNMYLADEYNNNIKKVYNNNSFGEEYEFLKKIFKGENNGK